MSSENFNKSFQTGQVEHGQVGSVEGKLHQDRLLNPGPGSTDLAATARHDQATGERLVRVAPFVAFVVGMWFLIVDRGSELGVTLGLYPHVDDTPNWYMTILLLTPVVLAYLLRKILPIVFYVGLFAWLIWWLVF